MEPGTGPVLVLPWHAFGQRSSLAGANLIIYDSVQEAQQAPIHSSDEIINLSEYDISPVLPNNLAADVIAGFGSMSHFWVPARTPRNRAANRRLLRNGMSIVSIVSTHDIFSEVGLGLLRQIEITSRVFFAKDAVTRNVLAVMRELLPEILRLAEDDVISYPRKGRAEQYRMNRDLIKASSRLCYQLLGLLPQDSLETYPGWDKFLNSIQHVGKLIGSHGPSQLEDSRWADLVLCDEHVREYNISMLDGPA